MGSVSPPEYIEDLRNALAQLDLNAVKQVVLRLNEVRREGRTIFVIGNGGSAATASHFANDLNKLASRNNKPMFRALCLTDNASLLTAWANDTAFAYIFSNQIRNFEQPGDVVVILSTSGESANVCDAAIWAKGNGLGVIAVTASALSNLAGWSDLVILTPAPRQTQQEDLALAVCHMLAEALS